VRGSRINNWDDEALLSLAASSSDAFAVFYDRSLPKVIAYFRRRVAQPEHAFDLAAETFARVLSSVDHFNPERGPAMAWVLRIARNLLIDAERRRAVDDRARQKLGISAVELTEEDIAQVERLGDVGVAEATSALQRLPAEQRAAVWARIVLEHDYDRLAADLVCSPSVARQRVSRGLRALRADMTEDSA
jgi:RNA polymerase sigma factor (sigma-70 family)